MHRLKTNESFLSGLLILLVGVFFAVLSQRLTFGTVSQMGPGFFPRVLSWGLIGLGVFFLVRSRWRNKEPEEWPMLKALVIVCVAPLVFGALIRTTGLAFTVVATALFARLALPGRIAWIDFVAAMLLSAFCCVVFVILLGQSLPIWP